MKINFEPKNSLDTRTVLHRHDLFSCEFWVCVWDLDVPKLWVVKILTESVAVLELIEVVDLFIE